ncbi:MAG: Ig-like domain-containing protein, partial [Oscillatoria sp. PMC 1051.18]|nr:Ig-like domain-containing protein [Oscillatoria sp. PMC 1051.18]
MEIIKPNLNIDSNFLSSLNRINTALNGSEQTDTITGGINRGQENVYRFLKGEGLHLPSSGTTSYSLELIFKFDETDGYRKILDFAGRTQDTGLYVYSGQITFYDVSSATGGTVNSNEYNHLILTRSNDNTVVAYLNGQQIFSFNDSSNLAVINASDGLNIFIEDTLQGTEQSAGHLDLLSFWSSNTLSSTQALHRYNSLQDLSIAPSVNITSDRSELNSGETATITFTFSKEITDFDLNDIAVTGGTISNLTGGIGGTITASGENAPEEGKEEAFDQSLSTKWLTFNNTGWLQYEFETPVVVTDYHLTSGDDEPARDPKDWQLQGSNDGVNFVNLESQTNQNFSGRLETKSFHIPSANQQAYQYYRLNITANHGLDSYGDATLQLVELELIYDSIYTATFTPEEDSKTTANIQVGSDYFDLSGNLGTANSITIDIDTDETAPTLTITSDQSELNSGETATITFAFSEEVSGFNSSDITVTGGTLGTISTSDNQIYTATFTPEEDSQTTANIQVGSDYFDLSGNLGTGNSITIEIDTYEIDETAPTLVITSDKSELSSGETATITFTFSEE